MTQNSDTTTFNDRMYDVFLTINGGNKANISNMVYSNICKISILETLYDPFHSAVVEYLDDQQSLERIKNNDDIKKINKLLGNLGYRYRGDGHDVVTITITPHENVSNNVKKPILLHCECCVVDAYRTYNPNTNHFTKTLILEDYTKHILTERQSFFTTKPSNLTNLAYRSNSERCVFSGNAIKTMLTNCFGTECINEQCWNYGGSPIFYSAGINEKYIDTLYNILNLHHSSSSHIFDIEFLLHDIGTHNLWSLISLSDMYKKAIVDKNTPGQAHIDTVYLDSPQNNTIATKKSKYTVNNTLVDGTASLALSYDFKDIQRNDAININSHIVYNYNTLDKSFNIDCFDGNIENFEEYFNTNFVKHMIGDNNSAYPNIPITKCKVSNGSFNNVFNTYHYSNISVGRNKMLKLATLLNNGIEITTLGSTLRRPGLFISVDTQLGNSGGAYNDKIYGEYLIVSSTHIFEGNKYHTNMVCVKPYLYSKPIDLLEGVING